MFPEFPAEGMNNLFNNINNNDEPANGANIAAAGAPAPAAAVAAVAQAGLAPAPAAAGAAAVVPKDNLGSRVARVLVEGGKRFVSLPGYACSFIQGMGLYFSASSLEKEAESAVKEGSQIFLRAKGLLSEAEGIKKKLEIQGVPAKIQQAFKNADEAQKELEIKLRDLKTYCEKVKQRIEKVKNTSQKLDERDRSLSYIKTVNTAIQEKINSLKSLFEKVVENTGAIKVQYEVNRLNDMRLIPSPLQQEPSWTQKKVSVLVDKASQLAASVDKTIPSSTGKIMAAAATLVAGCWLFPLLTTTGTTIGAIAHFSGLAEKARKYVVEFGRKEVPLVPVRDFSDLPLYSSMRKGKLVDEMKSNVSRPIIPDRVLPFDKKYSTLRSSIQLVEQQTVLQDRLPFAIENRLSESDLFGGDIGRIVEKFPYLSVDQQDALHAIALVLRKNHEQAGGKINQQDLESLITNFDVLIQGGLPNGIFVDGKKINELIVLLDLKCKQRSAEGYEKIYKSLVNIFGEVKYPTDMASVNPFDVVFDLAKLISNLDVQSANDVINLQADKENQTLNKAPELIIVEIPFNKSVSNLKTTEFKTSDGQTVKYDYTGTVSWDREEKCSTVHLKSKNNWVHLNFIDNCVTGLNEKEMLDKLQYFRLVILKRKNNRYSSLMNLFRS